MRGFQQMIFILTHSRLTYLKYSPGGRIHIDCSKHNGTSIVSVSDEGPGIDEQNAGQIFERYRRGTHSKRGAGLGLYVARQIIRAHGGDLHLHRSSPEGSCFIFTFNPDQATPWE